MNLSYSPPGEQAPPSLFTSANHVSLFQRSLLPLALSQQLELLGFHENFFHLAVPSLFPLPGPFPRSGSLVHCVLKQPVCMYRKGAPKWGGPSLTLSFQRDRLTLENLYTSFSLLMNSRVSYHSYHEQQYQCYLLKCIWTYTVHVHVEFYNTVYVTASQPVYSNRQEAFKK